MTVRGGGVPTCFLAFQRRKGEWVRRFGASLPMRMTASWSGPWTHRIQGCGATEPRPKAGSPLIVIPIALSDAVVLEAVKVWPGKPGACRKVGATANLDSSCARRRQRAAGRDEETGFEIEQRN